MVKILLDMGNGEIVELKKDKFDRTETICGMIDEYLENNDVYGFSYEKCTYNGVDILPSTVLTKDHKEICVKVRPNKLCRISESVVRGLTRRFDAKFSAIMNILTEKVDDDTLSRVQTVKSMVGQLLSPKDTPEYTKLNADHSDLLKKFASTQEENSRLKEVIQKCQAECREKDEISGKLRDELNRSRSQCSTNLQMLEGYKQRVDEEIEKNVKSKNDLKDLNEKIAQLREQIEPLKKELAAKEKARKQQEEREMAQKVLDANEEGEGEEESSELEFTFDEEEESSEEEDE